MVCPLMIYSKEAALRSWWWPTAWTEALGYKLRRVYIAGHDFSHELN